MSVTWQSKKFSFTSHFRETTSFGLPSGSVVAVPKMMKGGEAEMRVGWTRAEAPSDATGGRLRWSPGKGRLLPRKSPGGARRARKTQTKRRRRSGRSLHPPAAPAHLQVAQVLPRAVRLPAGMVTNSDLFCQLFYN